MTPLGKSLVFYLKYMAAMNHLCFPDDHGGEPDLTGVEDPEHVREMAHTVKAAAFEQVADFLELCGKEIKDHFTGLGIKQFSKEPKRAKVMSGWQWYINVHGSSVPVNSFRCGVWVTAPPEVHIRLENDVCGVVVPWLWYEDSQKAADEIWQILGGWAYARSGELVSPGSVALACIPIKAQPPESFDADRDSLIAEVMKTIARITAEQTEAIARAVAGLKKPNEG